MSALAPLVSTLLADLEVADPIDFGDMPANDDATRQLVVLSMVKFSDDLTAQGLPPEAREALALAATARVLLDNMSLHYRLLKATGAPAESVDQLLGRLGVRKG